MVDAVVSEEVRVGPQGRVVIPARLRRSLGINVGDRLIARTDGERLVMERPETIRSRVFDRFQAIPPGVSLAQELIDERRAEAIREAEG